MKWKGNEFIPDEKALYHWGDGPEQTSLVTVIRWDKEYTGFWYIKLENGLPHYTKFLSKLES